MFASVRGTSGFQMSISVWPPWKMQLLPVQS
jgi:hypothetical protein